MISGHADRQDLTNDRQSTGDLQFFLLVSIFISYLLFFMILQLCHFRYYFFLYFWNKKQMV